MRVLLVHGLGRTPASLMLLRHALKRAGHAPSNFAYFAFAEPYEHIRDRLVARLAELSADPAPLALIGHSLGGLLLRDALGQAPGLNVHRLIMLGTPNQSPRRARRVESWLPFRVFARTSGALLASTTAMEKIAKPTVPYTIIAGTGGYRWLSAPFDGEAHDGVVSVDETRIPDGAEPVLMEVSHTFMMNDRKLQSVILGLLS
ncbi:MAG: esterase/lipase family protein [Gemmatimonas sp.]